MSENRLEIAVGGVVLALAVGFAVIPSPINRIVWIIFFIYDFGVFPFGRGDQCWY